MNIRKQMTEDRGQQDKNIPIEAFRFAGDAKVTANDSSARFVGVAYSGGILKHPFWGEVAFDLATTTSSAKKLPMLIGHDRNKNAGFSEAVTIDSTISVAGVLLNNKHGARIKDDAAQGFPWQLSVHISPDDVLEVEAGYTINGHTFSREGVVFKNATLREISFTPTGVDASTSASIFSFTYFDQHQGQQPTSKEGHAVTEDEAKALQAENAALKEKFTALEASAKEARDNARRLVTKTLFSDCGIKDEDSKHADVLLGLSTVQFEAVASLLREKTAAVTTLPDQLFHEHADAGQPQGGDDPLFAGMKAAVDAVQGV